MVDGKELWNSAVTEGMEEKTLSDGTVIETFSDLPDNLYEALRSSAGKYPDKVFLTDNYGREDCYKRFLIKSEELAAYLYATKGVCRGTHVGLLMHNCEEYCVAFFALQRLAAVTVPLPGKFKRAEVLALAKRAEVELVICEASYARWFDAYEEDFVCVVGEVEQEYGFSSCLENWTGRTAHSDCMKGVPNGSSEDAAVLMFTSGTTSQSKGVLLKNYNIMHAVESYRRTLGIKESDRTVIATPVYHITGLIAILGLFALVGGSVDIHRVFNAKRVIAAARERGYTFLHASPTVFHLLIQEGEDATTIPSLRNFACGSSNMPKNKLLRLHRWLPHSCFHTVYGLTETSSPGSVFPVDVATSSNIGSSGLAIPGVKLKIVDERGVEMLQGEVGEIAIKGTVVLQGYYKVMEDSLKDGWLHTGDLGYLNQDNYLFVVDRKKNMINRGGEKIWCFDVENEILSMEDVEDAAVVGIPDEIYGEVAAALVQVKHASSVDAAAIREYLIHRIAGFKVPVKIQLVDHIPLTPNGKIDKVSIQSLLKED